MATNFRAIQAFGSAKMKNKQDPLVAPGDTNIRQMTGGSWHADISREGKRRFKGAKRDAKS